MFAIKRRYIMGGLGGSVQNSYRDVLVYSSFVHSAWMLVCLMSSQYLFLFYTVDYSYDLNSKMLGNVRTFKNQSKRFQGLVSIFSPKLLTFFLSVSESKCLLYVVLFCHYYMCIFCYERSSYRLAQVAVQSYWLCTIQYN